MGQTPHILAINTSGRPSPLLFYQRLETRVLTQRVPDRVETQVPDGEGKDVRDRQDALDLIDGALDFTGGGEDMGLVLAHPGSRVLVIGALHVGDGAGESNRLLVAQIAMSAVETLVSNGVVVIVSGGNGHDDGTSDPYYNVAYPARSPKVITVGATTTDYQGTNYLERITAYSSNGDPSDPVIKPDLAAPGGDTCCSGGAITGAQPMTRDVFDNFSGCFVWDNSTAAIARGPNDPSGRADYAFRFRATESGAVDRITWAVGPNTSGTCTFDFWIANDSGGFPGTRNGNAWNNATVSSANAWFWPWDQSTILTAGQEYWLVVSVDGLSAVQQLAWYLNAIGDGGAGAISDTTGGNWAGFMGLRGGFRIRTSTSGDGFTHSAGTSFAAPHVAGVASLLVQAIEDTEGAWQFTEAEVLNVKAILQMTATETVVAGENPVQCSEYNDPQANALNRGGKDRVEGYGRMNADAAIEAATMVWDPNMVEQTWLGAAEIDKKCWARQVTLTVAANTHLIDLDVPDGSDFDLYLYDLTAGGDGEPVVTLSSTTADTAGATNDEQICIGVGADTTYYIVVKWVEGTGEFTLSHSGVSVAEVCDNGIDDDCDGLVDGDDPDCGGSGCAFCIIVNGDFSDGLNDWNTNIGGNAGHPTPQITVENVSPMTDALHVTRDLDSDGSHAVVNQDYAGATVNPGDAVTLEFDVIVNSHNFGGYSGWNAYPANVWVVYEDTLGDPYTIRRSFYNFVSGGHTPDPEPIAEQIDAGVWEHRSFDLSDASPPIATITRVQLGSVGWSYDVAFDNVSLTVDEPCLGDLDGNGQIDLTDLSIVLANFGTSSGATPEDGDLNGDGDVDLEDLAQILALFGTSCP